MYQRVEGMNESWERFIHFFNKLIFRPSHQNWKMRDSENEKINIINNLKVALKGAT